MINKHLPDLVAKVWLKIYMQDYVLCNTFKEITEKRLKWHGHETRRVREVREHMVKMSTDNKHSRKKRKEDQRLGGRCL